jgi:hypothetical protein
MAVTNQKSVEVTAIDAGKKNAGVSYGGMLRKYDFTFVQATAAGDITSTAELIRLPPGRCEIILPLSYAQWSAFGAARLLDIGYAAYTGVDGVAVVAAPAAFDDDVDVAAAGGAVLGSDAAAATGKRFILQSRDGVSIIATVAGGTIIVGAALTGFFVVSN